MKIHVAHAQTDSGHNYTFVFKHKPNRAEVIKKVYDLELVADLNWYDEFTGVEYSEIEFQFIELAQQP